MTETVLSTAPARRPVKRRAGWRLGERPVVWLFPLALLLFVSYLYPAVEVVRFSFTDATLLKPEYEYTLSSYRAVFGNPDLAGILRATLIFVIASVGLQLWLGLLIALALNRG